MEKAKLDRISELSRIARERELTEDEHLERQQLRSEYRESVVGNLRAQLESITIVEPDGSKVEVKDRMKKSSRGGN